MTTEPTNTKPKRPVYGQPEILATTTYSVGNLLAEEDDWTRVDLHEGVIANIRRALAAGEAELAIQMAATVRKTQVMNVAVLIRTGEVPDVFVREHA